MQAAVAGRVLSVAVGLGGLVAAVAGCASPGVDSRGLLTSDGGVQIGDRRHDGGPDIVNIALSRSEAAGAVLRVRVERLNKQRYARDFLVLFVDPVGEGSRFTSMIFLDFPGVQPGWAVPSQGWRFSGDHTLPGCRFSLRMLRPGRTVRIVELEFPPGCIGSSGARLALRAVGANEAAATSDTRLMGSDWWPKPRTMSEALHF